MHISRIPGENQKDQPEGLYFMGGEQTMGEYVVGIDIGGTKCAVLLGKTTVGNNDYSILQRECFQTEVSRGPGPIIRQLISVIRKILEDRGIGCRQVTSIGISCGGPLDHVRGIIQNPPNLYGWNDIPIVEILEKEFGIPAYIQNDANACALAEWKFGAAAGFRDVIFLTCGTGMGAGLILDGRLYNGADSMAGEVGHVRMDINGPVGYGKSGSFEGFCSGSGIAQLARIKVLEKLQAGERPVFCPKPGMLDSLTAKSVAAAARQEIEKEALGISRKRCQIVPAKLGNHIGDYAALSVAIQGGEQ